MNTTSFESTATTAATSPSTASINGTTEHVSASIDIRTHDLAGAVVGSFFAGVLVVIVIFLIVRQYRRARAKKSTVPDGNHYKNDTASASAWLEENKQLRTQLNETQAERAQLRAYYQLDDTRDVRDVVESFQKFNVLVRNSCLLASSAVLRSVQSQGWKAASSSWTTKDAINPRQLHKVLDGAAALISSSSPSSEEKSAGRKLDEFLPEAFRFVVNAALVHQLFAVFHPDLSDNDNALLMNAYRDIRSRDPQRLSAQWRCLTYNSLDRSTSSPASSPKAIRDWAHNFANEVSNQLSLLLSSLIGDSSDSPTAKGNGKKQHPLLPSKLREELASLGADAYEWNRYVKSSFKSLDLHPVIFGSGEPFDRARMTLYHDHRPAPTQDADTTPRVLAGVTMALKSTSAVGEVVASGEREEKQSVWQIKAEVLTEGYFR